MVKVPVSTLIAVLSAVALSLARADSLRVVNRCGTNVWIRDAYPGGARMINAPAGQTVGAAQGISQTAASGGGVALDFLTGCDTNGNGCATDRIAYSRAEVSWPHVAAGAAFINLSNLSNPIFHPEQQQYGYSVATEITGSGCQDYVCNIASGCPAPGPNGSCLSPCCSTSSGCQGADSCPAGSRGDPHGGKGVHSDFYVSACPNTYAWGDQDSDQRTRNLGSYCSGADIVVTLCPGKSSSHL
ncbi:hypothetical protein CBS101457_004944 [Exobasidium rhododendri]|nr:hypothetical protein CBS101457_004944 [Exobasidium rhododendri]